MNYLDLIGRDSELFYSDIEKIDQCLSEIISENRFLVIGGAGSIGQSVAREIFKRNPRTLHIVDISEKNNSESRPIKSR